MATKRKPKPKRRILSRDSVLGSLGTSPAQRRKQAPEAEGEPKKRGVERVFPAAWKRQAFIIHPSVNYALGILARVDGVPISSVVNEALARVVLKRKGDVTWAGKHTAPKNLADFMPPKQPE